MKKTTRDNKRFRIRAEEQLKLKGPPSYNEMNESNIQSMIHELQVHQIELEMQNEELRKTQISLEDARNKFEDLYEFSPVGYLTINEKGKIIKSNQTAAQMFGVPKQYVINKHFNHFIASESQDIFYLHCNSIISIDQEGTCELKLKKIEENTYSTLDVQLNCKLAKPIKNKLYQLNITLTDITNLNKIVSENKKVQDLIVAKEKYDGMRQLAGKIAHDFNNILAIIMGKSELSMMDCKEGEIKEAFRIIYEQAERGNETTKELIIFSKNNVPKNKPIISKNQKIYTNKYILIVEDEEQLSNMQREVLVNKPFNHNVDIAKDGHIALKLIEKNRYDFITLDYILPGKFNGMHIYEHIREIDSTVPVLFISGNMQFLESIKELRKNDNNIDNLPKPHEINEYVNYVNRLIGLSFDKKEV